MKIQIHCEHLQLGYEPPLLEIDDEIVELTPDQVNKDTLISILIDGGYDRENLNNNLERAYRDEFMKINLYCSLTGKTCIGYSGWQHRFSVQRRDEAGSVDFNKIYECPSSKRATINKNGESEVK